MAKRPFFFIFFGIFSLVALYAEARSRYYKGPRVGLTQREPLDQEVHSQIQQPSYFQRRTSYYQPPLKRHTLMKKHLYQHNQRPSDRRPSYFHRRNSMNELPRTSGLNLYGRNPIYDKRFYSPPSPQLTASPSYRKLGERNRMLKFNNYHHHRGPPGGGYHSHHHITEPYYHKNRHTNRGRNRKVKKMKFYGGSDNEIESATKAVEKRRLYLPMLVKTKRPKRPPPPTSRRFYYDSERGAVKALINLITESEDAQDLKIKYDSYQEPKFEYNFHEPESKYEYDLLNYRRPIDKDRLVDFSQSSNSLYGPGDGFDYPMFSDLETNEIEDDEDKYSYYDYEIKDIEDGGEEGSTTKKSGRSFAEELVEANYAEQNNNYFECRSCSEFEEKLNGLGGRRRSYETTERSRSHLDSRQPRLIEDPLKYLKSQEVDGMAASF